MVRSHRQQAGSSPRALEKTDVTRQGFTMVELVVVMAVLLTALSIFSQTMVAASKQRTINRENAVAAEAIRTLFETMRSEPFRDIYVLYNGRDDDDPGGVGSAPGARFAVEGLEPLPGAPDGLIGEVHMPTMVPAPLGPIGAGGALPPELRENTNNPTLGMPRDLNGNSIIEDDDRAQDYILLPVRVTLDWQGAFGPRRMEMLTMFAELNP